MPVAKSSIDLCVLETGLARHGLCVLGALQLAENHCANGEGSFAGASAILIGNAGSKMWTHFAASPEFSDGQKDPMNRWTERTISNLIGEVDCEVRYPFDLPYWPFQRIACDAMGVEPSPLGILVHPEYGLWHAFRAIIIANQNSDLAQSVQGLIQQVQKLIHPCETCSEKPCLSACPVSAFDGKSLDVKTCFGHVDSKAKPDCMTVGCGARNACPVGTEHKYQNAQIEFHMKSYRGVS